jgi:flagellar hook protein FlgE
MSAIQSGVSGMLANQARLDAVGNNIANANTIGYKSARVLFSDALYQVLKPAGAPTANLGGTNPNVVGQGVLVAGTDISFTQGNLMATGRTTDVAIDGSGFLPVTDGTHVFYTRNGALGIDADGYLVHLASGFRVLALPASTGTATSLNVTPASTLRIPLGEASIARATTQIEMSGNLDAQLTPGTPYPVTAHVYDSLGGDHTITLNFSRAATGDAWDVSATSPDGTVTVPPPAQLTFDQDGQPTLGELPLQMTLTTPNGANPTLDFRLVTSSMTQLAQDSTASLHSQDGLAPGVLSGILLNNDGSIVGVHSNGLINGLGQMVTAIFSNTSGLEPRGSNLFGASLNSGEAQIGKPSINGRGILRSGQLETSNVNLAQEFADMIVTQRGFQASSRVVTAADQVLQELINVGR